MDEFNLIKTYFAPLARDFPGSLNLTDDTALLTPPAGKQLVITKDAVCEGVHFIGDEDAALIAKKLLRTNLSDLAAKGAEPWCYLLAGMLPAGTNEPWIKRFAEGLAEDQKTFHIYLAGGDTTSTKAGMGLSLTAIGTVSEGSALLRSGAKAGDDVYVSGTIGDSALGLASLRTRRSNPDWIATGATRPRDDEAFLINRYLLPQPRVTLGQKLRNVATACMDISDGLVQDLGHLCNASGVGAVIHRNHIPLSAPTNALVNADKTLWNSVLGGGDDYELLFTAPPDKASAITALSQSLALPLTKIGATVKEKGVTVVDENSQEIRLEKTGYRHFG